ncbi:UNVERIFIED_CONTAM: hypothetical protein Sradi_0212700 [Sesamum radiatum]|uniref:Reverse transcriptase domain-containing protein n=1 Tax=Sesamum radiatum TaxID=300843 RepID=A0AAW2W107_SESRA
MENRVTKDMNGELTRPLAGEEIMLALKQMHPLKSPGPDGCLITDNVLVAYEINHFLSQKRQGQSNYASLKLDFGFLRPERGIRQGDPLSPYLFLFYTEALSHLIQQAESQGTIQGISVSSQAPRVSYLLFTDDTMIFCKASPKAILEIHRILKLFEGTFGLKINLEKSAILFHLNTLVQSRETLANVFGVIVKRKHDKYLCLPSMVGRSKCKVIEGLKHRIWQKINGWAMKKLSQSGRAVLIKPVLQAIPSYIMTYFDILESILRELEAMMANFFWQGGGDTKIH